MEQKAKKQKTEESSEESDVFSETSTLIFAITCNICDRITLSTVPVYMLEKEQREDAAALATRECSWTTCDEGGGAARRLAYLLGHECVSEIEGLKFGTLVDYDSFAEGAFHATGECVLVPLIVNSK